MPREYSVVEHGMMLADRRRTDAYLTAIRNTVRPGSVVVDLGSGTGIFTLAACECGARRVYAVESGEIAKTAREVITANGFGQRVDFVDQLSTATMLPEHADVVVFDVRGVLPDEQIPVAIDARRFLGGGGRTIPASDTLWAALVTAPDLFDRHIVGPSHDGNGVNLKVLRERAVNRWYKCRLTSTDLLTAPQALVTFDYARTANARVQASTEWTVSRPGTAHGFAVWFESVLSEGVELSNAPGSPPLIYGQGYFPWPQPISLTLGQRVHLELTGMTVGDTYGWQWITRILNNEDERASDVRFDQSALGDAIAPSDPPNAVGLSEDGLVDRAILSLIAERKTVAEIASRVQTRYPRLFPSMREALERVGALSTQYG